MPFEPFERRVANVGPMHVDRDAAILYYRHFMESLGLPVEGDTEETPRRVTDAVIELMASEPWNFTTFPVPHPHAVVGGEGDLGMVVIKDIPWSSLCAHHMLPMFGHATVAYIPDRRMAGLSKLARLVKSFAAGPQTQEVIGMNVADTLMAELNPRGCMVILSASHTCMSVRGACAVGAVTRTSALRGVFFSDPRTREEAMALLR